MPDEWVLVGAKRRSRKATAARPHRAAGHVHNKTTALAVNQEPFDPNARVSEAKQKAIQAHVARIATTLMTQEGTSIIDVALRATADHLGWSDQSLERRHLHVVSYGLGSFCSSSNAVYQLAFVHALVQATKQQYEHVETTLEIFDPVMNASDREIAGALEIRTIDDNESGKRVASTPTVFFMPHCGHVLYQNVIVANYSANTLPNTLIIGNSFEAYGDRLIDASSRRASVVLSVLPFVTESSLPLGVLSSNDDFALFESAFNDLSIHTFSHDQAVAASASVSLSTLIEEIQSADGSADSSVLTAAIDRELIA